MALQNLLQEIVLFILFVNVGFVLVNQTEIAPGIWMTTGQVRLNGLETTFLGLSDQYIQYQIDLYNGQNNILLNSKATNCPYGLCFLTPLSDVWNMILNLASFVLNVFMLALSGTRLMVDVLINCTIGAPQFYTNIFMVFGDPVAANQYGLMLGGIQCIVMLVGFMDYIKGFI
jgi:hypothetical protein